jgi:hypothetical protein
MARHAYWVILVGATPTAFRSSTRDVLVPTLRQLQHTQPDVTLRWFERGRLWESPEAARFGLRAKPADVEKRRPEWRPGGDHRDPRARFELTRDQKRARFKDRARRPQEPPAAKSGAEPPPDSPRPPDQSKRPWRPDRPPRRPWQRPTNGTGSGGRFSGPRGDRPPHSHGSNRPFKPQGDRPGPGPGQKPQRPFAPHAHGPKPQRPFTPHGPGPKPQRPGGPSSNRPTPYRDRPKGRGPGRPPTGRHGPGRPPGGRGGPNRGGGGNRQR